ncbi:TPA: aminotransferase class I/II-fold pyridoxal phosphate-dependent enzyme [Serratia marcescens]|uniref:aminotransferase class I/II-fold pyridoxal phosphate-dependent enzyme n=1 Tax=Proteus genomosp. 4 TaxID=1311818 RepID=UPI000D68D9FA|nr:aminotransferase class I/II-fold pyridoxal phosphate-dependent enzyme [Proteus genomosp. 4]HEM7578004.1 aminotransferase class I/II-fold pyridoxal phosphate-dependent enzyme [Serratia marcescens]
MKNNHTFIIDEAYAEFVPTLEFISTISLVVAEYKNLIVARTFSKIYALARLHIGFGVSVPEVISQIDALVSINNTNTAGAVATLTSLKNKIYVEYSRKSIDISRQIVVDALKELNIMVDREFPSAFGWCRLTLGTSEDVSYFVTTSRAFRAKNWI